MDIARTNIATVILNSNNEVLLCQRSKLKKIAPLVWHIPGGKVEEGETYEDTAEKEIREELALKLIDFGPDIEAFYDYESNSELHRTLFWPVRVEGSVVLNPESEAVKFVSVESLSEYLQPEFLSFNLEAVNKSIELELFSEITL
jgi:8-oxo-dGTP diphosphatase